MATEEQFLITFAGNRLRLIASPQVALAARRELEPFFVFEREHGSQCAPFATLNVCQNALPSDSRPSGSGTNVVIDSSLYKHLASNGELWGDESHYVIHIGVTDAWVQFDKLSRNVRLYHPDLGACVLETVRMVKSLFTPALERSGAVQLHGSAVVGREGCVLILADMWHGKTTLLLEMLAGFNVAQLSCDTVVLSTGEAGNTLVTGWPSPFSVSHGTIADFPELYTSFPPERRGVSYGQLWEDRKKEVLSSADVVLSFETHLEPRAARIAVCLIAKFAPEEPTTIDRLTDPGRILQLLKTVYLGSRDPIYHNWHRLIVADGEQIDRSLRRWSENLAGGETYALTWAPSAVSLMKRVPSLARIHKHLPRIVV